MGSAALLGPVEASGLTRFDKNFGEDVTSIFPKNETPAMRIGSGAGRFTCFRFRLLYKSSPPCYSEVCRTKTAPGNP
jgi:hypothetical protein